MFCHFNFQRYKTMSTSYFPFPVCRCWRLLLGPTLIFTLTKSPTFASLSNSPCSQLLLTFLRFKKSFSFWQEQQTESFLAVHIFVSPSFSAFPFLFPFFFDTLSLHLLFLFSSHHPSFFHHLLSSLFNFDFSFASHILFSTFVRAFFCFLQSFLCFISINSFLTLVFDYIVDHLHDEHLRGSRIRARRPSKQQ